MTKSTSGFVKRFRFLIFNFLMVIAIFNFPKFLTHVSEYDQKVISYTSPEDVSKNVFLPSSRLDIGETDLSSTKGYFTVSAGREEIKYLYLPFYVGRLKLWIGDSLFFDSNAENAPRPATQISQALVEIPALHDRTQPEQYDEVRISFELIPSHDGLSSLSKIYVGSSDTFNQPILINRAYYDIFRTGLLGAQIMLLTLLIGAFVLQGLGPEAIAPILILVFLVMLGFGSLPDVHSSIFMLGQFAISTSPAAIIAFVMYFNFIYLEKLDKKNNIRFLLLILIFLIPPTLILCGISDFPTYNLFVGVPALLFGLFLLSVWSIFVYMKSLRIEIGFWAFSSTLMLAAVLQDFLFRIAVLNVAGVTSILSSSVLIVILSATFIRIILSSKEQLANANNILTKALADQSATLQSEFENSARLLKETTVAAEQTRLTKELHDGVLTYMGIINALSERGSEPTMQKINQLARYAVNEIRIILDARPGDQHSLTIALGSLREQMVDPLRNIGVKVDWSNVALLDYGKIDPKALMNIIRIIQEAIHNAVVRAGCAHLSLVAHHTDGAYKIIITNAGGRPFCEENRRGHGIVNMIDRAASIGSEVTINPTDCGAVVTLSIPRSRQLF